MRGCVIGWRASGGRWGGGGGGMSRGGGRWILAQCQSSGSLRERSRLWNGSASFCQRTLVSVGVFGPQPWPTRSWKGGAGGRFGEGVGFNFLSLYTVPLRSGGECEISWGGQKRRVSWSRVTLGKPELRGISCSRKLTHLLYKLALN